jgi:hypothetical protein
MKLGKRNALSDKRLRNVQGWGIVVELSCLCDACELIGQEGRFAARGFDRRPNISPKQRFLPAGYGDQYSSAAGRGLNRSPRGPGEGGSESSGSESSDLEDEDY